MAIQTPPSRGTSVHAGVAFHGRRCLPDRDDLPLPSHDEPLDADRLSERTDAGEGAASRRPRRYVWSSTAAAGACDRTDSMPFLAAAFVL
jgi:hypothetical protein